jgi:hypothetical protein
LNLLFWSKNFAQESKKFQKMDKKNVQKSIWRNLFAQKRAALGNLRNFFGDHFARPYMVRGHAPPLNPFVGGRHQKGGFPGAACPFLGVSCFQKKGFGVLGTVFGAMEATACPFLGVSCFRKTRLADFRGAAERFAATACPFLGVSCFRKTRLADFRGHSIVLGPVVGVVVFIGIKIGPRMVIRLVGGLLPSGDAVCCFKRNIPAKREYH